MAGNVTLYALAFFIAVSALTALALRWLDGRRLTNAATRLVQAAADTRTASYLDLDNDPSFCSSCIARSYPDHFTFRSYTVNTAGTRVMRAWRQPLCSTCGSVRYRRWGVVLFVLPLIPGEQYLIASGPSGIGAHIRRVCSAKERQLWLRVLQEACRNGEGARRALNSREH